MAEALDTKELFHFVDSASGDFASAAESFADAAALFEAIVCATSEHNLGHRLANLGLEFCDRLSRNFEERRDEYNAHTTRYLPHFQSTAAQAVASSKSRRISDAEQSSRGVE